MEEKLLLDVVINEDDIESAVRTIKDARNSLDALKKVQQDLEKQGLKNTTAYIKNEAEMKKLNATVNENTRILTANAQIQATAEGSTDRLKAEVAALTIQYNKLSEAEKENTESGKKLAAQITLKNNKLNEQKERLGQNSSLLGRFAQQTGAAVASNQHLAVAQGTLNNVMKANPIILIVGLLGQLFNALSQNEEVMDAIEPILTGINQTFKVMADIVLALVKPLIKLFQDPKAAMMDFVTFLENQVMNRLKSFGTIMEGIINMDFKKIADGLGQAALGVESITTTVGEYATKLSDAATSAYDLTQAQDALDEALLESNELAAKNNIEITKLNKAYQDKTKTDAERAEALQELMVLEDQSFQAQRKNANEQLRILEEQSKLSTLSQADAEKLSQARIAVYNLEAQAVARSEAAANRIRKLQEEINADREKALEKQKAATEKEKNALLDLEQLRLELTSKHSATIEEKVNNEIALEEFKRDRLLSNENLLAAEREAIILKSEEAIAAIKVNGEKETQARVKEERAKAEQELKTQFDAELAAHEDYVQGLINQEREKYLQGVISKEQYDKQIADLEIASLQAEADIREQFGQDTTDVESQQLEARMAQKEFETDMAIQSEQKKFDAVTGILGMAAENFNKQSVAYKALASAQTLISTYQAAMEAYKSLSGIPVVGPALGAVAAGLVTVAGLKNVAKINSTAPPQVPAPKAEEGMLIPISGPSHAHGGVDVAIGGQTVANVEGKEHMVILNKNATPLLHQLSAINRLTGGVDFVKTPTPKTYLADGGYVNRVATSQVNALNQQVMNDQLINAIGRMRVVAQISQINRVNRLEDISIATSQLD